MQGSRDGGSDRRDAYAAILVSAGWLAARLPRANLGELDSHHHHDREQGRAGQYLQVRRRALSVASERPEDAA